ncbi:MAG: hypothetical protein PUP91_39480, partial [Rhizonema sp. PD37]|nr:hypothetical protein [Rhizonema sp. PD37]
MKLPYIISLSFLSWLLGAGRCFKSAEPPNALPLSWRFIQIVLGINRPSDSPVAYGGKTAF